MHTFLFADICDYTAFTLLHGDECAADVAVDFHALVGLLAEELDCELVKAWGDATMVRATSVAKAVALARLIHANAAEHGFPKLRIGIDTGPATLRGGDWYGTTVNTAARVTAAAAPGELMMTERARAAWDEGIRAVDRGRFRLKGLPDCNLHAAYASISSSAHAAAADAR